MKRIITVDVPESIKDYKPSFVVFEDGTHFYRSSDNKVTEFIPPNNEEIRIEAVTKGNDEKEVSWFAQGAYYFKSLLQ